MFSRIITNIKIFIWKWCIYLGIPAIDFWNAATSFTDVAESNNPAEYFYSVYKMKRPFVTPREYWLGNHGFYKFLVTSYNENRTKVPSATIVYGFKTLDALTICHAKYFMDITAAANGYEFAFINDFYKPSKLGAVSIRSALEFASQNKHAHVFILLHTYLEEYKVDFPEFKNYHVVIQPLYTELGLIGKSAKEIRERITEISKALISEEKVCQYKRICTSMNTAEFTLLELTHDATMKFLASAHDLSILQVKAIMNGIDSITLETTIELSKEAKEFLERAKGYEIALR